MANNPFKDTTVKYVNKDFSSFKRDLMRFAQSHFSGSFQDFNESSPGMAILELQSYIGDVLAFYMDQQFLETKDQTARLLQNVEDFAKMRGYKPKGKRAATCQVKWIVEVPSTTTTNGASTPDLFYAPVLKAGSQAQGPGGVVFETLEDLDFSKTTADNPAESIPSQFNTDGSPSHYAIRRQVTMVGATTVTENIPVGDFVPWARIPLGNPDLIEVLSVNDSDANEWFEVDYLSQNVVFDQESNLGQDTDTVPYVLKFRSASKRFVVDRSLARSTVHLQFGPGQGLKFDDEIVPNVAQLALPLLGRRTFSLFALDPQNFLRTQSMGLAPYNTVMTVKYRVGGGPETNVPVGSIKTVLNSLLEFKSTSLDPGTVDTVRSSIECINREASEGGGPAETIAEIKSNAGSYFAAQGRAVTREDYLTHVLSMPSRFGKPEKAYVRLSDNNPLSIDVHMLARDIDGKLVRPSPTLQKNVITYISRLRMITEGVNIRPAYVINLGVDFGVVVSPKFNRTEVMASCLGAIKDKLDTDKMQIGQPIVYSDLETTLQNIDGVISVYQLNVKSFFSPRNGLTYSQDVSFDVDAATKHGIIYCPQDSIFEIRHPEADITGASK